MAREDLDPILVVRDDHALVAHRTRPLTRSQWMALFVLAHRAPHLVSHADLYAIMWPGETIVEPAQVYSHLSRLRKALADAGLPDVIETIERRGYRLAMPAHRVDIEAHPVLPDELHHLMS